MVESKKKLTSHRWWFDSHNNTDARRSSWLQSTLSELDEKTEAMLKLIEEDADSFAERAEMYYKKRPELINMFEDFYRSHRSLAERYDQVKSESVNHPLSPWTASPLSSSNSRRERRSMSSSDKTYDSYSDTIELEESDVSKVDEDSEVDDPEEEEVQVQTEMQKEEVPPSAPVDEEEVEKLKEEIERLNEENRAGREQLLEKDEEKREVIRQLSIALDMLREENDMLRKISKKESPVKQSSKKLNKFKEVFRKKLFKGFPRSQACEVL